MKGKWLTVILIVILIAGLSLLLYPTFSSYWNSMHATKTIATYAQEMEDMDEAELVQMWEAAVEYNRHFRGSGESSFDSNGHTLSGEQLEQYMSLLNIGDTGMMGYVDIESIGVSLPIYHGTSDGVLQVAAGHLDWTSLPVGGESTHCVISGHRGLPSAKLFTDLDKLHEGEIFTMTILNQVLTYEIDQIRIVEPQNTQDLLIEPGKDYCTLLTCTPYGINTHRLLVRGHRIATAENLTGVRVVSEAMQIEPLLVASVMAALPLLILIILVLTRKKKTPVLSEVRHHEKKF